MTLSEFSVNVNTEFRVKKNKIAGGNFGDVFEGWRIKDNKHVAIKILKEKDLDQDAQIDLIREIQLLASFKHPGCLNLIGFSIGKDIIIITPFMPNGSLEKALKDCYEKNPGYEAFSPTKRMCSIYGICSIMSYIHSLNIIHRDFKPENVFLDENYEVVIADFGLSRIVQENIYLTKGTLGSPIYMAPEIYTKDVLYTNSIDVFSFGVTLYHYFVQNMGVLDDGQGRVRSPMNYLNRIKEGARLIQYDEIPDKYYEIYQRCTDKSPESRPTFQDLAELFEIDKELLLDGVKEDEYYDYINRCKDILSHINENDNSEPENSPPPIAPNPDFYY